MVVRAGVEPTTLRLKAINSTKAPPCPTFIQICGQTEGQSYRQIGTLTDRHNKSRQIEGQTDRWNRKDGDLSNA